MSAARDVDPDSEPFLKTVETAGAIAGMVGVVALLAGGALGLQAMTATRPGLDGLEQHPTFGVGIAITLLSIGLALLAAMMSWVALSYARPRLGVIANIRHEEKHRAELDVYLASQNTGRNAQDRRP